MRPPNPRRESMKRVRHWTPRYAVNKFAWITYDRKTPDEPCLNPTANRILETLLVPTDGGLEWGSGKSTAWIASRIRHLTSMEHDPGWYDTVRRRLRESSVENVDYHLV